MQDKDEKYWRKKLTPEQYHVLREKGTEVPFTGSLLNNKEKGLYVCAACGSRLFSSEEKYESGTGWPSFWQALDKDSVGLEDDFELGIRRIEVKCAKCGGHLGHVFEDGPQPTGKRYCINSCALNFKKNK